MASLTDDNEAGGNLDKRNIWSIGVGHTSPFMMKYLQTNQQSPDNIQTNTTGRFPPCLQKKIDKMTYLVEVLFLIQVPKA